MPCRAELKMLRKQKEHGLDQVQILRVYSDLEKPLNSWNMFAFLSVRITLCGKALKNTCPYVRKAYDMLYGPWHALQRTACPGQWAWIED